VLDPDVVARFDAGTAGPAASVVLHGAAAVAGQALRVNHPAALVRPALVNGAAGVVVTLAGQPVAVAGFTVSRGKIVEIDVVADPERLRGLDLSAVDG
jgi:ribosomal protein S4